LIVKVAPLAITVDPDPAIVPPVQLKLPLTVRVPFPWSVLPLWLTTPWIPTVLAAARSSVLETIASVYVPLAPPRVRLLAAAFTSTVTVYVPARVIETSSAEVGT